MARLEEENRDFLAALEDAMEQYKLQVGCPFCRLGRLSRGGRLPQNGRKSLNGDLGQGPLAEDDVEMCVVPHCGEGQNSGGSALTATPGTFGWSWHLGAAC